MNPRIDERTLACHWMLLRLAGWVSDDTLARCRTWLAEDRLVDYAVPEIDGAALHRAGAALLRYLHEAGR